MKGGFININKAAGMTSHDVVNRVRRIFGTKKVGHAGTLDPFATGVLPIAVGCATGFLAYLNDERKSYRAEILFGLETDTGDVTGNTTKLVDFFDSSWVWRNKKSFADLEATLKNFVGEITQTPPKYSAVKINGRKAYELARKGMEFELPKRQVVIYKIELVAYTENSILIDVECSKGTYIRSLAVDIGHALGTVATLKSLKRTHVGEFGIFESITLEDVTDDNIIPIENCLIHLAKIKLPNWRLKAFFNGLSTRIDDNLDEGTICRVYCNDEFVGVGKIIDSELKATKIYNTSANAKVHAK